MNKLIHTTIVMFGKSNINFCWLTIYLARAKWISWFCYNKCTKTVTPIKYNEILKMTEKSKFYTEMDEKKTFFNPLFYIEVFLII